MANVNPWQIVSLKLWHGGSFKKSGESLVYNSRSFRVVGVDPDELCWFTVLEEAEKCGSFRRNVDGIFYLKPGVGLQKAENDKDVAVICELAVAKRLVECYIVVERDIPQLVKLINDSLVLENSESIVNNPKKLTPRRRKEAGKGESLNTSENKGPQETNSTCKTLKASINNTSHIQSAPSHTCTTEISNKSFESPPKCLDTSTQCNESKYDFNDTRIVDLFDRFEENADLAGLNIVEDFEWDDLSEEDDPGYEPDEEGVNDDEDSSSDVQLTDEELIEIEILNEEVENFIENEVESDDNSDEELQLARKKVKCWNANALKIARQLQIEAASTLLPGQEKVAVESTSLTSGKTLVHEGRLSDYDNSDDEIHTPCESEEDPIPGKRKKKSVPEVDEKSDFSKLRWCVGIRFPNREVFRDCVIRYAIAQGRNLTFDKSHKARGQRLGVRCVLGCPFKLYASWDNKRACLLVKSIDPNHTCHRNMESNRQLKSTWLAKQFLEVFKTRPHWPASEIIETVRRAYKVLIKKNFAYKVKYLAHRMLHGSMKEHYSKMGSYIQALSDGDPNSVFTLTTIPDKVPIFHRFFVCFHALKQGWIEGCRKVLCIDSCFLKTFLGGQLIAATGRDANEQMYPLAWAVVEGENNSSYEWFFKELKKALEEEDGDGWTILSDEHQSIVTMVAQEFPKAEHRHCARHIFANWHKSYKGDEMKLLFWNCAKAYNQADFDEALSAMKEVDHRAVEAFLACNPTLFCRAFIKTTTKTDVIVNNMAETFNAYIIEARAKHLIYMLEDIRSAMMQRLVLKKAEMEKKELTVCPRVQVRLEEEKDKAAEYTVLPSSASVFQVKHGIDELKIDLLARTCTCRKWDLTGIPCSHAVAAIFSIHGQAEDYVDDSYKKEAYLRAYSGSIAPCPGQRHWPKVNMTLNPPPIKVGPGRPRKKRRKDPHEDPKNSGKLTKHGIEMTCSVCKSKSHNKRKCPDKDKVVQPPTKRGRGRPSNNSTVREEVATTSTLHHTATAQPTRIGRGGKVVRTGRGGSRGGGRGRTSNGGSRAGSRGTTRGGSRGERGRAPQGFGVLFDDQGSAYTNVPSNATGPISISSFDGPITQATQASVNQP